MPSNTRLECLISRKLMFTSVSQSWVSLSIGMAFQRFQCFARNPHADISKLWKIVLQFVLRRESMTVLGKECFEEKRREDGEESEFHALGNRNGDSPWSIKKLEDRPRAFKCQNALSLLRFFVRCCISFICALRQGYSRSASFLKP